MNAGERVYERWPCSRIYVIGEGLILYGLYDPDQFWFDFMRGCVFQRPPERERVVTDIERERFRLEIQRANIKIATEAGAKQRPDWCFNELWPLDGNPAQLRLPFDASLEISSMALNILGEAAFALFERTADGELAVVTVRYEDFPAAVAWCREMCRERYATDRNRKTITFQSLTEAAVAKFRWHQAAVPVAS